MRTTNILSFLAVAVAAMFMPGLSFSKAAESNGRYELIKVENPAFRGNQLFGSHEDLRCPRFQQLRDRYLVKTCGTPAPNDEIATVLALHDEVACDRADKGLA